MESRTFLNWSFRLFHIAGMEVRVHWSLLATSALSCWWAYSHGAAVWLLPILVLVPLIAVLLHELGHAFMTRLVGGEATQLVLWALGGLAQCAVPATPGKRFAVAAAGPLVNFLLYAICEIAASHQGEAGAALGQLTFFLNFVAMINLGLLLFNLIPAYPLDGGAMLRAALWPVVGLSRAVSWTIAIAYIVLGVMATWSVITSNVMLFAISLWLLVAVIQEHIARNRGFDPYLGLSDHMDPNGPALIDSWLERRRARQRERDEQAASQEQVILDRLLAKVSEQGLPSLTEEERSTLQRISKRQRARQGTAS